MENLVELKDRYFEAQAAHASENSLLENIRKRGPATQLKFNQKNKDLSELDEIFKVTLKQIARGEKEEADLTSIRVEMDSLKLEIQNLQDLLDILKRTEIESSSKVTKLAEKVRGANHSFWFEVSKQESEKIRVDNSNPILRAYGAYVLSGLGENFGYFLESRFNAFRIDLENIMNGLKSEYLSTKGGK